MRQAPPPSCCSSTEPGAGRGSSTVGTTPFRAPRLAAIDHHEGLDVAAASHEDYARNVVAAAEELQAPVALCGWSMGGLVVLQAAQVIRLDSVVLLEASPPAEVQGVHPDVEIAGGSFDPEVVYGPFPGACGRGRSRHRHARSASADVPLAVADRLGVRPAQPPAQAPTSSLKAGSSRIRSKSESPFA